MVILRPTRRLSSLLPSTAIVPTRSDTALGDWYVNRLVVDRQPLLMLVSSTSLLSMLVPARDVRGLPGRLEALVRDRLARSGIDGPTIDAETRAMTPVAIAPTIDRSVLGIMADFARTVRYLLAPSQWNEASLGQAEDRLAENPCYASGPDDRVIFPNRKAPEVLKATWGLRGGQVH